MQIHKILHFHPQRWHPPNDPPKNKSLGLTWIQPGFDSDKRKKQDTGLQKQDTEGLQN